MVFVTACCAARKVIPGNGAMGAVSARLRLLCACLSTFLAQHANHNKSVIARVYCKSASRLHACATAHASFFFLSCCAMLVAPLYLKCIWINLDVDMFALKFGVDEMFGCWVKCIRISTVRTQQTRMSAHFTDTLSTSSKYEYSTCRSLKEGRVFCICNQLPVLQFI